MEVTSINSISAVKKHNTISASKMFTNKTNNNNLIKNVKSDISFGGKPEPKTLFDVFAPIIINALEKAAQNAAKKAAVNSKYTQAIELFQITPATIKSYSLFDKALDPLKDTVDAQNAIKFFNKFKDGFFLAPEIGESTVKANLSFLNCVKNHSDKKEFIDYYRNLTGFPNLTLTSNNILKEFTRATKATEQELLNNSAVGHIAKIMGSGYDGISSVARKVAFPGADLNNAYVILKGNYFISSDTTPLADSILVKNYLNTLRKNTDHRIMSYSNHKYSTPHIYTENQMRWAAEMLKNMEEGAFSPTTKKSIAIPLYAYLKLQGTNMSMHYYNSLLDELEPNFETANAYFKKIAKQVDFERKLSDVLKPGKYNRDDMFRFCTFMEAFTKGDVFQQYKGAQEPWQGRITPYYINMSQINATKNKKGIVDCYAEEARKALHKEFDSLDIDYQYDIIKTAIESSAGQKPIYSKFTNGEIEFMYDELKKDLMILPTT